MKILLVSSSLSRGGAERVAAILIRRWLDYGHEIEYVLTYPKIQEDIQIDPRTVIRYSNSKRRGGTLNKIRFIRREIRANKIDIVLCLQSGARAAICALACRGTNAKLVVSERNSPADYPIRRLERILRRFAFSHANAVVFQTPQARDWFSRRIRNKGTIIYNPYELGLKPTEETIRNEILYVGRITPQKNITFLLDAFELFSKTHPDYMLSLVGKDEQNGAMQSYAFALKCAKQIRFIPFVKDMSPVYSRAKIQVLTSDYEGVPNVLIEGALFGIPAVARDARPGGVLPLIQDGVSGIVVPLHAEPSCFADAMSKVVANYETFHAGAKQNGKRIKEMCDTDKIARAWIDLFNSLCSRN